MKHLFTLTALALLCTVAKAQNEPETKTKNNDTIRIGNIIITKDGNRNDDSHGGNTHISVGKKRDRKLSNISTNWGIVDLGFSNYIDESNYGATGTYLFNRPGATPLGENDFKLRTGKSINVNIWFFMQRLNVIKHHVNLKYGLGLELNNYRYKPAVSVSYLEQNSFMPTQSTAPIVFRDSIQFSKNKLAADYLTVPLMLNFTSTPAYKNKGVSLSVGVSAGYLYSSRNKQVSTERGKQKNRGEYDLERFKLSYIAELGLGPIRLYGSYSPDSFYSNGLDMKPYTLGIRFSNW